MRLSCVATWKITRHKRCFIFMKRPMVLAIRNILKRLFPFSEKEESFLNAGYQYSAALKEWVRAPGPAESRSLDVGSRVKESYLDRILGVNNI